MLVPYTRFEEIIKNIPKIQHNISEITDIFHNNDVNDIMYEQCNINIAEERTKNEDEELKNKIRNGSIKSSFPLTEVQILAISKIVNPDSIKFQTYSALYRDLYFRTPGSDIQRPLILNLPNGYGKTIITILGSILFSIIREKEINSQHNKKNETSSSGCIPDLGIFKSSRKCVTFVTQSHLNAWIHDFQIAVEILKHVVPDWKITIYVNSNTNDIYLEQKELAWIISDSKPNRIIDHGVFIPCICFDDTMINNKNVLTSSTCDSLLYGRAIIIASSGQLFESKPESDSILKLIFDKWCTNLPYDPRMYNHERGFRIKAKAVAQITMACIFPRDKERVILHEHINTISNIKIDIYGIPYYLSHRDKNGWTDTTQSLKALSTAISMEYGFHIDDCDTLGDITLKSDIYKTEKNKKLKENLNRILTDICPICLENYTSVNIVDIIHPCQHIFCHNCSSKIESTCPICRNMIFDSIMIKPTNETQSEYMLGKRYRNTNIGQNFQNNYEIKKQTIHGNNIQVMRDILRIIKRIKNTSKQKIKVLIITEQSEFTSYMFNHTGFNIEDIIVLYDKNIDRELDYVYTHKNINIVISIGKGNIPRRLAILANIKRSTFSLEKQDSIFIHMYSEIIQ